MKTETVDTKTLEQAADVHFEMVAANVRLRRELAEALEVVTALLRRLDHATVAGISKPGGSDAWAEVLVARALLEKQGVRHD